MQRVAVVDANVIRVLARLRTLSADQKSKPIVKLNAKLADCLVDPDRPGCFNQVAVCCPLTGAFMLSSEVKMLRLKAVPLSTQLECPVYQLWLLPFSSTCQV